MLKKIKDILGIEGVRISLRLKDSYDIKTGEIEGHIIFEAQNPKHVESVHLSLIERYRRGRGEQTLINEYTLGQLDLRLDMLLDKNEIREISFVLPFSLMKSDMDRLEDKALLGRPFIWLAKKLKKVQSNYRIEAEAIIRGTRLHPLDKKEIIFK